jgi:hypothetical protein
MEASLGSILDGLHEIGKLLRRDRSSEGRAPARREFRLGTEDLVELTRIELVTSSMPWKRSTN